MVQLAWFLTGFWFALDFFDTYLTRDGIKSGKIQEHYKYLRWFMENDFRAWLLYAIELIFIGIAMYFAGKFLVLPMAIALYFKIRVCLHNYNLNKKLL